MGGGIVTARTGTTMILRPGPNDAIIATVDCLAGETVIGGGVRTEATVPGDLERMHLQESGPDGNGWLARASATSRFSPNSTFTVTATVYCLAP